MLHQSRFLLKNSLIETGVYNSYPRVSMKAWLQNMLGMLMITEWNPASSSRLIFCGLQEDREVVYLGSTTVQ